MRDSRGGTIAFAGVVAAFLVNFPLAHSTWQQWQLDRDGVEVTAQVTDAAQQSDGADPTYRIVFILPDEVDEGGSSWTAVVDEETRQQAQATGAVEVRVLPDDPSVHEVVGEVPSRVLVVATVVADLLLLGMVLLARRARGRMRPQLELRATEDVQRTAPGVLLERIVDQEYVVAGDVEEIEDDAILLDLGNRKVKVHLDGHHNPVGYQQTARVTGIMVR